MLDNTLIYAIVNYVFAIHWHGVVLKGEWPMATESKAKNDDQWQRGREPLLTRTEFGVMMGLILVALGLVFFLGESNQLAYDTPWWTLFIGIPGLTFLFAGALTVRHHRQVTGLAWAQFVIGGLAVLLALSFLIDPNWSFTRGWTFFSGEFWNTFWKWGLLILGMVIAGVGVWRRRMPAVVAGAVIAVVGAMFVLGLDWDRVWPLFIVGIGILILAGVLVRRR